ncbi:MAG: hypothetical protein ABMA15_29535, partial [Vicinamibacterales bacterium]
MMFRRLISAAALVACTGLYVFAAPERATFILTDGERKSGPVVYHGDQHENLINGYLNLGVDGGKDMTFPINQVAVIDFVGGVPPTSELALLGARHVLVMRDGTTQEGRFVNLTGGDTLFWENTGGQQQRFPIQAVKRIYLNSESARTVFNYTAPAATAAAAAAIAGVTVRVDAQQQWVDTGLTVRQGDRVTFQASGQIQVAPGEASTPDGIGLSAAPARPNRRGSPGSAEYPAPAVAVGGLLGRIGNGSPFG